VLYFGIVLHNTGELIAVVTKVGYFGEERKRFCGLIVWSMLETNKVGNVLNLLEEVEPDGFVGAVELILDLLAVYGVTEDDPLGSGALLVVGTAEGVILLIKLLNFRYDYQFLPCPYPLPAEANQPLYRIELQLAPKIISVYLHQHFGYYLLLHWPQSSAQSNALLAQTIVICWRGRFGGWYSTVGEV
jgi:hypothetical protein